MLQLIFAAFCFCLACVLAGRLRVMGASVLIHHLSSHEPTKRERARRIADWIGVATLTTHSLGYAKPHGVHHGSLFASAADPDAALLFDLGFRPGTTYPALWRRFWWTLVSPRFHAIMTRDRLRGVFFEGPLWRRSAAVGFWGGLLSLASAVGVLNGLLLGLVLPLIFVGNLCAFLELASEHRWMVSDLVGNERHRALSHGRHLGAMPPQGINPLNWLSWGLKMLGAVVLRLSVVPGDLPWHNAHHTSLEATQRLHKRGWANAAYEYSGHLWQQGESGNQAVATLSEAIDRWFIALSQELPIDPDRMLAPGP